MNNVDELHLQTFYGREISRVIMLIMTGGETHAIGWPIKVAMPIISENWEFSRLTYGEQGVKFFCFLTWDRAGLGRCSHILPISHHSRTCAHFRLSLYRCQPPLTPSPIPWGAHVLTHTQTGKMGASKMRAFAIFNLITMADQQTYQRTNGRTKPLIELRVYY